MAAYGIGQVYEAFRSLSNSQDSLWALASEFPRLRCQISELNSAISAVIRNGGIAISKKVMNFVGDLEEGQVFSKHKTRAEN